MNRIKIILFFWLAFATQHLFASGPVLTKPVRKDVHPGVQFLNHKDWNFVENKGQLPPDPLKGETIKYYGHQGGVYLYCQTGKISFVFTKTESKETDKISEATCLPVSNVGVQNPEPLHLKRADKITTSHPLPAIALATARIDLILLNSNPSAEIISSDQQEYYENYYTTGDADHGITNVHTYKTITYKEIYPHINMVLHCKPQGMKYEFIVHPGGKVSDIQMRWEGIEGIKKLKDSLSAQAGKIEYSCALGGMSEEKPVSFQGKNIIESDFITHSNLVGFKVDGYDKSKDLVIDPTLIWGTYFGGKKYDECLSVATDPSGNVYISGWTESSSGVATSGAYQTSLAGGSSAYIAKFDSSGSIKWATYYGGQGSGDAAYGLSVDGNGNAYITGLTDSCIGLATSGAYQTSYGGGIYGGNDAFLAKFNTNGVILWATYFGGSGRDQGNGIATDGAGNVYIIGETTSKSGIATNGAFQTYYSGAIPSLSGNNAFIAKFKSNGSIVWATYFGSTQTIGMGISADGIGNIYCTGYTDSTINISTSGAYQTSFGGGDIDVFLAKFKDDGTQLWATYFGGNGWEDVYNVTSNASGAVYISGATFSTSGIATSGAYQTSFTSKYSGFDIFFASFDNGGSLQWSTYYGATNYLFGAEIAIDVAGNVFFAASTSNLSGIATSGAYLTSNRNGDTEGFLAEFNNKGKRLWATYYGGTNWANIPIGAAIDIYGNVYLAGYTNSTTDIATKNAYKSTYPGGGQDAFLAKFHNITGSNDAGIDSYISPSGNYCMDTIPVMVRLENFGLNALDSVKIFSSINGKVQTPYLWTGKLPTDSTAIINLGNAIFQPGSNSIKTWTSRPNGQTDSFPGNDTAATNVNVYSLPAANAGPDTLLCYDEVYTMQGSGGVTYTWHPAIYLSSATDPNAKAVLPNTENYVLVVTNSVGCSDSAPVLLKVRPKPNVKAYVTNSPVCYGQSAIIYARGSGGDSLHYSFSWPVDSLNGDTITKKVFASGWHTVILNDNCSPSQAIDSVYVLVSPKLSIKAFALNNPVCYGQNVILYAMGSGGDSLHYQYQWVDDGLSGDSVNEKGYQSGWHKVTLTDNCSPASVMDSIYIRVLSPPKADFISIPGNMVKAKTKIGFQNQSSNALAYLWTFGNRDTSTTVSPVYIYTDTGDYKITLVAYGTGPCPNDTAYETIQIIKDQITIYIPDAFTPNGDGINDLFVISGIGISSYSYNIYNRWGEHIYSSPLERPGEAGWDGNFKGLPVPEGVYIYMFDIIDVEGQHHYINGNVTLMR